MTAQIEPPRPTTPAIAPAQDERVVSALSHLMVFLAFTWIPVAIIAAIYFIWRDRSRYVRFQSGQAFAYALVLATVTWVAVSVFSSNPLFWCLLIPTVVMIALAHLYALWGAAATLGGQNFVYLGVGPVVAGLLEKPPGSSS